MREDDLMAKWAAKRDASAGTSLPIGRAVTGLEVVKVWKNCLGCGRTWQGNAFTPETTKGWCDACIDKQEAQAREAAAKPKAHRPTVQELRAPREVEDDALPY